jgi:diacylglycerol O-acyltransferase
MRQLSSLDAQFLHVETPTTVGHVGSLILLDPSTAPGGRWDLESVRAVFEPRLHLAAPLRQRLVEVPLGLGRPYWVDDPHFDLEFHLRELALPEPGTAAQLGEQVSRIHARPLDRTRPLWEAYVITGVEGGRCAFYSKIHHAAIDGVSGAEILEAILDISVEPRQVEPEDAAYVPREMPSTVDLVRRGLHAMAVNPVEVLRTVPKSLQYVDQLPGATNIPGTRLISQTAGAVGRLLGEPAHHRPDPRDLKPPRTPLNGTITAHRRFAFGSLPLDDVKTVKSHFGMTVNDAVMALTASALRRWLLDHDALPETPLVVAVPVSVRTRGQQGELGNQVSVMLAELPTHLRDPRERLAFMRVSMLQAKRAFKAVPASLLQDMSTLIPTALSGLAARALFRLATVPGLVFNLFVSNVPGPQLPLYIAGAKVEGIYPVSAVTDLTGGLNITLFSYNGSLDFGLIACREMVPDVWNLIGYLEDAMAEMLALVAEDQAAAGHEDDEDDT